MVERSRGRLHVYLAPFAGAGKTYAMLARGRHLADEGVDVVVGLVETHGRADIEAMAQSLERVPPRRVAYRGATFLELDVDAVLARHPGVALVDELAHTCVPGSPHEKRWEDVEEILDAGIDMITTLNVQHLDSVHDAVDFLMDAPRLETVPDAVVATADRVDLVDVTPEQLRARIDESGALGASSKAVALGGFFAEDRLRALRKLAVRWLADNDFPNHAGWDAHPRPPAQPERGVVVAMTGAPEGEHVLRRAGQIAASLEAELTGVRVLEPSAGLGEPRWLARQLRVLSELGGRYAELGEEDVATAVLGFARRQGAAHLVLGKTRRSRWQELLHGSVINKAIRSAGPIEVHVIPPVRPPKRTEPAVHPGPPAAGRVELPSHRRAAAWGLAVVGPVLITLGLIPLRSSLGLTGALLCALLAVVATALLGGIRPAVLATVVAVALCDFFFTPPLHSLRVARPVDIVALVVFAIVAMAVGELVDVLTRQSVQVARAKSEAENLARLAADSLSGATEMADAVGSIRRAFGLDAVTLFRNRGAAWQMEAAAGTASIERLEDAEYRVEVSRGAVLALVGHRLTDQDATLLRVFLGQLHLAAGRAALDRLERGGTDPTAG